MNWYKKAQEDNINISLKPKGYKVTAKKIKEHNKYWYVPQIWFNEQLSHMPSMYAMFEFKDEAIKEGWSWLAWELNHPNGN